MGEWEAGWGSGARRKWESETRGESRLAEDGSQWLPGWKEERPLRPQNRWTVAGGAWLFTRLESSLVPAGFLTAQFLQKTQLMKPLSWWENRGGVSHHWLHGEEEIGDEPFLHNFKPLCRHNPFAPRNQLREALSYFPNQNKGFINHSFWRNGRSETLLGQG